MRLHVNSDRLRPCVSEGPHEYVIESVQEYVPRAELYGRTEQNR